jgi:hypothetical protein
MTYAKLQAACATCASGLRALPRDTKRVMERMGSAGKRTYLTFVKWALPFTPSQRNRPESPAPSDAPEDTADAELEAEEEPQVEEQPIAPSDEPSDDVSEDEETKTPDDASIEVSKSHRIPKQTDSALLVSPP